MALTGSSDIRSAEVDPSHATALGRPREGKDGPGTLIGSLVPPSGGEPLGVTSGFTREQSARPMMQKRHFASAPVSHAEQVVRRGRR